MEWPLQALTVGLDFPLPLSYKDRFPEFGSKLRGVHRAGRFSCRRRATAREHPSERHDIGKFVPRI